MQAWVGFEVLKYSQFINFFFWKMEPHQDFLQQFYTFSIPKPHILYKTYPDIKSQLKLLLQIATNSTLKQSQDKKNPLKQIFFCKKKERKCFKIEVDFSTQGWYRIQDDYTQMRHLQNCEENGPQQNYTKIYNLMMLKKDLIKQFMKDNHLQNGSPQMILQEISRKCSINNKRTQTMNKTEMDERKYNSFYPNEYFYTREVTKSESRRRLKKRFDNIINISIKSKWENNIPIYDETDRNDTSKNMGQKIKNEQKREENINNNEGTDRVVRKKKISKISQHQREYKCKQRTSEYNNTRKIHKRMRARGDKKKQKINKRRSKQSYSFGDPCDSDEDQMGQQHIGHTPSINQPGLIFYEDQEDFHSYHKNHHEDPMNMFKQSPQSIMAKSNMEQLQERMDIEQPQQKIKSQKKTQNNVENPSILFGTQKDDDQISNQRISRPKKKVKRNGSGRKKWQKLILEEKQKKVNFNLQQKDNGFKKQINIPSIEIVNSIQSVKKRKKNQEDSEEEANRIIQNAESVIQMWENQHNQIDLQLDQLDRHRNYDFFDSFSDPPVMMGSLEKKSLKEIDKNPAYEDENEMVDENA